METSKTLPLKGVKVLELATVVAAPTVCRVLASYGADVIKIETPPAGDSLRIVGQGHMMPTEVGNNPLFDLCNTGKKTISINLKTKEGMEIFHKLISKSDIFVSNVRMKSLVKMNIDYESLKEKYPRLIYAHFSGFGLTGEDKDRPGFDATAFWMRSGLSLDTLLPGSFPIRPPFACGDIVSAANFLGGIMMALYARQNTGYGTLVSTSLLGCGIWSAATSVINAQEQYGKQYPLDRYHPWDPFNDFYECADGEWLAVMDKGYVASREVLAKIFELPELVDDPECADLGILRESGKVVSVVEKTEKLVKTKPFREWEKILLENDVPYERLCRFKDVKDDKQAWAIGALESVEYPDGSITAMPMPPITFSEYGRLGYERLNDVGENTEEILKELGYSEGEIAGFSEAKVIK